VTIRKPTVHNRKYFKINCMTYPDIKYYSGKQTKADKMVGAYGTYGGK
jgi:hypothetical protein